MSTQMKTPGVYVRERNAFPNSAVEAATAIPAFIGYTQKVGNNDELLNKPVRIESFNEFREKFGSYPEYEFEITLNDETIDTIINKTKFNFYNQINLFFTNGGGVCYIVSIGDYNGNIEKSKFIEALTALEYEDEPTLIVAPEAAFLIEADLSSVNQAILAHCEKMKFRFGILDTVKESEESKETSKKGKLDSKLISNFRNGIGNKSLNFGAAYYPWLKTNVISGNIFSYKNIYVGIESLIGHIYKKYNNTFGKDLHDIILSATIINKIENEAGGNENIYEFLNTNVNHLSSDIKNGIIIKIEDTKKELSNSFKKDSIISLFQYTKGTENYDEISKESIKPIFNKEINEINEPITEELFNEFINPTELNNVISELEKNIININNNENAKKHYDHLIQLKKYTEDFKKINDLSALSNLIKLIPEPNIKIESAIILKDYLYMIFDSSTIHKTLYNNLPLYKEIFTRLQEELNTLPPSTAIAGMYTYIDTNKGVWKSPANVSLDGVVSPLVILNNDEQADLNMPMNGKAINAIRSFKNDGIKVWGARTLDGNSQDWRYINVKRTMMMIQSTLKSACNAYIFEANDANTWVSIKSVINNYLHSVWKRGGLAGSTPEDAYYVSIGLGETMTPNDVLDGILRIEILVAMVRPAEFIEITFQQQMQKS